MCLQVSGYYDGVRVRGANGLLVPAHVGLGPDVVAQVVLVVVVGRRVVSTPKRK